MQGWIVIFLSFSDYVDIVHSLAPFFTLEDEHVVILAGLGAGQSVRGR